MPTTAYLATDERLVMEIRRHPVILLGPFSLAILGLVLAGVLGAALTPARGDDPIDTVLGLIAVFLMARLGWKLVEWRLDRLVVTDQRVIEVSGILARRVASMPLMKVTDMTYNRSVWGRLLNYGELVLESAGQDQALGKIRYIPHPNDFYRTITSLIASHTRGVSGIVRIPEPPTDPSDDDTGPIPRVIV